MTYFDSQAPIRKKLPATVAGLALFVAAAISIGGINLFGFYMGFGFLPLLVLAIWPRRAVPLMSLIIVFLVGFFTDWATGGITGQWALVFVVIWGWLRPELRSTPFSPVSLILMWLLTCGIALALISVSGWFVYRTFPDIVSLGRQIVFATALLPVFMLLRRFVSARFGDQEDWGG